jgi:Flp pilus assembly protein TadG
MPESINQRGRESGTATIELAVALPLLLLTMMATAEFGRMLSQYDVLNKAVRDGARYLAANALAAGGTTGVVTITAALTTATQNLVVTGNTNGTGSALLPNLTAGNVTVTNLGNGYVSVSAAYQYVPMLGANLPTFGNGSVNTQLTLNATTVMRPL